MSLRCHVTFKSQKKILHGDSCSDLLESIKTTFGIKGGISLQRYDNVFDDWEDIDLNEIGDKQKLKVIEKNASGELHGNIQSGKLDDHVIDIREPTERNTGQNGELLEVDPSSEAIEVMDVVLSSDDVEDLSDQYSVEFSQTKMKVPSKTSEVSPTSSKNVAEKTETTEGNGNSTQSAVNEKKSVTLKSWPIPFQIPVNKFRPCLQTALSSKQSLADFEKSTLIDALYDEMTKYTFRPTKTHYSEVVVNLLTLYPFLANGLTGQDAQVYWKNKLSQRFRNVRRRHEKNNPLAQPPAKKVTKNEAEKTKLKEGSETTQGNVWGIKNYLPKRPIGEDEHSISSHIDAMKVENKKKKQNACLIKSLMEITFADRRDAIVNKLSSVKQLKNDYPCLFDGDEILAEFYRATEINLKEVFAEGLKKYKLAILNVASNANKLVQTIMKMIEESEDDDHKKWLSGVGALIVLPSLLQENVQLLVCPVQMAKSSMRSAHIQYDGDVEGILKRTVADFNIVAEGQVISNTNDFVHAYQHLFAVHYVFNLQYNHKVNGTLTFVQKVIINMKDLNKTPYKVINTLFKLNTKLVTK